MPVVMGNEGRSRTGRTLGLAFTHMPQILPCSPSTAPFTSTKATESPPTRRLESWGPREQLEAPGATNQQRIFMDVSATVLTLLL